MMSLDADGEWLAQGEIRRMRGKADYSPLFAAVCCLRHPIKSDDQTYISVAERNINNTIR
jgi:hypothetical protein